MLCDHIGGIADHIAHGNVPSAKISKVAVIVPCRKFADQLHISGITQGFPVDGALVGDDDICVLRPFPDLLCGGRVGISRYIPELIKHIYADIGAYAVSFKDDYFHAYLLKKAGA